METIKVSAEVLTKLEDLAIKHDITVDKVVENLLEYYTIMQQAEADTPVLLEVERENEGVSPDNMRKMVRDMTEKQLAQPNRRSA